MTSGIDQESLDLGIYVISALLDIEVLLTQEFLTWSPGMVSESKWNPLNCMPNFCVCEIFWEEILNISLGFQRSIWPQNDKELNKSFGVKYQFSVGIDSGNS